MGTPKNIFELAGRRCAIFDSCAIAHVFQDRSLKLSTLQRLLALLLMAGSWFLSPSRRVPARLP